MSYDPTFSRLEILAGKEGMKKLAQTKVLLLGVGGVGSWCAEALIRSGVGHLTIVDSDLVCVTNINRQLQATYKTVGQSKVMALKERLLDIYPKAAVHAIDKVYDKDTADSFDLDTYDYVLDAIDSLSAKVELISRALKADTILYSSMGAACKLDPASVQIVSFWKTKGCPLAKFVRKRLRNRGATKNFKCVFSNANLPQGESSVGCGTGNCACPGVTEAGETAHEWCSSKKQINGASVNVTGVFGFFLASMVTNHVIGAN